MRIQKLLFFLGWVMALLAACGRAPEATGRPTTPQSKVVNTATVAPPTVSPTATLAPTPTPVPYKPKALHFPFEPADVGVQAFKATYQVFFGSEIEEDKPLRGLRYTAVSTPDRLDPYQAWIPPKYRGKDFLVLYGTHWEGARPLPWAYFHNMGRGTWMDGYLSSAWYDLAPEQARYVMGAFLMREAQILHSDGLAFFPQGQEDVLGLEATRYRIEVSDLTTINRRLAPTWLYDTATKHIQYGRTQLTDLEEGWLLLGPKDVVLGFSLRLRGTFTSRSDEVRPVTLRLIYDLEEMPPSATFVPERIPVDSKVVLPAPVTPPYFTDNLKKGFTYWGSPHTGLVWGFSFQGERSADEAQDLFDTFREVFREFGYRVLDIESNPIPNVYGRLPFQDKNGNTWYLTIGRQHLQIFQPPGAAPIRGEDRDYFGLPLLPDVVCSVIGGMPGPGHTCQVRPDTFCDAGELLEGSCPISGVQEGLMLPPVAQACINNYAQLVFTQKGEWQCRFGPDAACELQAYADGKCSVGGSTLQDLKPQPEQYSVVVKGHLRPGEVRFFRLPSLKEDFPPVEQSVDGEQLFWAPQGYVFFLKSDTGDVAMVLYDPSTNEVRTSTSVNGQMLVDTGADGNILELRAGSQETNFTLTVAALGMMGQGNVPYTAVGTIDDSGARYFLRFKPLSTLTIRLSGSGVYLGVYELPPGNTMPSKVLLSPKSRRLSVNLGVDARRVLIVVYGPPKARFRLYTLQHFVGP